MTWLLMLLVGATPMVSYGLACAGDSSAMWMTEQERHEPQHDHQMPCHGPCSDLDDDAPAPRVSDEDGEHFPAIPAGAMTCCIVTSSVTGPFAASSAKYEPNEADAESELARPVVLPSANVTRHPRVTAGPPPVVMSGSRAGTRTYLTTFRLRL